MIGQIFSFFAGKKPIKEQQKLASQQQAMGEASLRKADGIWQDYKTPQGIEDNLNDAQNNLNSRSMLMQMLQENADRNAANQTQNVKNAATSGAEALAGFNQVSLNQSQAMREASVTAEMERQRKRQELQSARTAQAGYKDKEWETNVNMKYLQELQKGNDLIGAGYQNKFGALNNLSKLYQGVGDGVD